LPLEAIHLAEVALSADSAHHGALAVNLEAHSVLEAASVNFWETSWLRHEIKTMRGILETGKA
jgi:hypothetical protein